MLRSWFRKPGVVRMAILPKLIYGFDAILIKIQADVLVEMTS